jgi:hypothetical protein
MKHTIAIAVLAAFFAFVLGYECGRSYDAQEAYLTGYSTGYSNGIAVCDSAWRDAQDHGNIRIAGEEI